MTYVDANIISVTRGSPRLNTPAAADDNDNVDDNAKTHHHYPYQGSVASERYVQSSCMIAMSMSSIALAPHTPTADRRSQETTLDIIMI